MLPRKLPLDLLEPLWASQLDPLLLNPANSISILKNISLINGVNTINHRLGEVPNGWFIIDINGAAQVYRSQPLNSLTLTLTSNAAVIVSLGVF